MTPQKTCFVGSLRPVKIQRIPNRLNKIHIFRRLFLMKKIVIASACRTAIGKFGGTLANVPAAELGSIVIKEAPKY